MCISERIKQTADDDDDPFDAELQEMCGLFTKLEKLPDAKERIGRAIVFLKHLAAGATMDFGVTPNEGRELTDSEAEEVADELFGAADICFHSSEADELAGVVTKIIRLVSNGDLTVRESNGTLLNLALYVKTADCSHQAMSFAATAVK